MVLRACAVGSGLLFVALAVLLRVFAGTVKEFVLLLAGFVASLQDVELTRER
jgi:hypothetical protein